MNDTEQEATPRVYEVSFDGKQPFKGSAVIGAFNAVNAEEAFRDSLPEEVTDLRVTVRELSEEEQTAFFQKLEGSITSH